MKKFGSFVLGFVFMLAFSGFVVGEEANMIIEENFGDLNYESTSNDSCDILGNDECERYVGVYYSHDHMVRIIMSIEEDNREFGSTEIISLIKKLIGENFEGEIFSLEEEIFLGNNVLVLEYDERQVVFWYSDRKFIYLEFSKTVEDSSYDSSFNDIMTAYIEKYPSDLVFEDDVILETWPSEIDGHNLLDVEYDADCVNIEGASVCMNVITLKYENFSGNYFEVILFDIFGQNELNIFRKAFLSLNMPHNLPYDYIYAIDTPGVTGFVWFTEKYDMVAIDVGSNLMGSDLRSDILFAIEHFYNKYPGVDIRFDDDNANLPPMPTTPTNIITVEIEKGWNLIYGFVEPNQIVEGDIVEKDIRAVYALVSQAQEYARVWPEPELDKIMAIDEDDIINSGLWVYSDESGYMTYELRNFIPYDERKIYAGWNFVGITEDMMGDHTLEDVVGDCNIERSYSFDSDNQEWVEFSLDLRINGDGVWVVNVAEDCVMGAENDVVISAPPILPGLGLSDDVPLENSIDGNNGEFPLELGGYALTRVMKDESCGDIEGTEVCMAFTYLWYGEEALEAMIGLASFSSQAEFDIYKNIAKEEFLNAESGYLLYTYLQDDDELIWLTESKYELVMVLSESLAESNPFVEYFYNTYPAVNPWTSSEEVVVAQVVVADEAQTEEKYYGDIKFSRYSGDSELR